LRQISTAKRRDHQSLPNNALHRLPHCLFAAPSVYHVLRYAPSSQCDRLHIWHFFATVDATDATPVGHRRALRLDGCTRNLVLAVAIRSVQAILASLQLGDNPVATGNARIENIAIGVATALVFIPLFAPAGWRREPQPVAIS
jgi:hypothetical protein